MAKQTLDPEKTYTPPITDEPKPANSTDPVLRLCGKIDRLLNKVPDPMRHWVVAYLMSKYMAGKP